MAGGDVLVNAARGGPRPMVGRMRRALIACLLAGPCLLVGHGAKAADLAEVTQLCRSGKYAECVQATEKAIAENDFSENYRLLKIRAEMELGRYADALKTLDEALKPFPPSLQLP